jgi:hypothetical protein
MTGFIDATAQVVSAVMQSAHEWLPAVLGSAVSLKFLGGTATLLQNWTSFAAGAVSAYYLGLGAAEYMQITTPKVVALMIFVSGVAGMATMYALMTEIPGAVSALRRKLIGE